MIRRALHFGLALTLGLVLLVRGLVWFTDYLRAQSRTPFVVASAVPATPRPIPTPTPLPEASIRELEALTAPDMPARRAAVETLRSRRHSAPVEAAARAALTDPANTSLREALLCLLARADGPDSIEAALRALPRDTRSFEYDWSVPEDQRCYVAALARQAAADPERIADALVAPLLSWNRQVHDDAVAGLERTGLGRLPARLEALLNAPEDHNRRFAWQGALAMGLVDLAPDKVERAIEDPILAQTVRRHLFESSRTGAARLLALVAARGARDRPLLDGLNQRERSRHDVSAALVEIAVSDGRMVDERRRALELLASLGEPGALAPLESLLLNAPPELTAYLESCLTTLRERARGRRPQMAELRP